MASEPLYAPEQIYIPPDLPDILKQFTKAAIKTQPDDIYKFGHDYFEALASGKEPPVSKRVSKALKRTEKFEVKKAAPVTTPPVSASQVLSIPNVGTLSSLWGKLSGLKSIDEFKTAAAGVGITGQVLSDVTYLLKDSSPAPPCFFVLLCGQADGVNSFNETLDMFVTSSSCSLDSAEVAQAGKFLESLDDDAGNFTAWLSGKGNVTSSLEEKEPIESTTEPVVEEPAEESPAAEEKAAAEPPAAEEKPAEEAPAAEEKPAEEAPAAEEKPAEEAPAAEEKPAEAPPAAEEKPAEEPPATEEKAAEEPPAAEEKPAEEAPASE